MIHTNIHSDDATLMWLPEQRLLFCGDEQYIRTLQRCRTEPKLRNLTLREFSAGWLDAGALHYFAPYEAVHRHNLDTALASP